MAKYRKASEKTISRGKGKSTDELSLADAKDYFRERAKETGAKRFRHQGQVYDLDGNKVSEAPARSSGSGSSPSLSRDNPTRPRANPARGPGGARPEPGKAAGMPAAKGERTSQAARNEPKAGVVAALGAAGVAAGVAASRAGRNSSKASGPSISDRVRAAGAKAKSAAMGVPAKQTASGRGDSKAETKVRTAATNNTSKAAGTAPKTGGGGRVGGAPVGRQLRSNLPGGRVLQMPDVMKLHLMNKGGMVKKK